MKVYLLVVIAALIVVGLVAGVILLHGSRDIVVSSDLDSSVGLCRAGFVVRMLSCGSGNESFDCSVCVRNESFECVDRIGQVETKGFPITLCGRQGVVVFEQRDTFGVDDLVRSNATVRFKGVSEYAYRPCEVEKRMKVQPQVPCGSVSTTFYVESVGELS